MIISSVENGEEKLLRILIHRPSAAHPYFVESIEDITLHRQRSEEEARKENLAALGTMISGIAHELNNPLTGIGLTLQNLTANLSTMDRDEILVRLNHLHKDMNRASRIISDILSFATPSKPKFSTGDLTQVIHRAWGNVNRLYPLLSKRVEWRYEGPESEIININQEKIERLFINLFKNSLQAFDYASGTILVSMTESDASVHIVIEDNAGGIPREHLNRIFLPFYSTGRDGRGSGLGLTICHQIIKEHNGRIRAGSSDGKTRFYISLPAGISAKQDE
jgi:signal transduction histidine kinase